MSQRKPFLEMPDSFFAHREGEVCFLSEVIEMHEKYEARIAELERSLRDADGEALGHLAKAGIATPEEGFRKAGWNWLGHHIDDLAKERDVALARIRELTEWRPMEPATLPRYRAVNVLCETVTFDGETPKRLVLRGWRTESGFYIDSVGLYKPLSWLPLPEVPPKDAGGEP